MENETQESTPASASNNETNGATNGGNGSQKTKKAKPSKPLPTNRLIFEKQTKVLLGYAAGYETTGKPAGLKDIADIVKLHRNTVTLINPFFAAIGLIKKQEGQHGYVPSKEVMAYGKAFEWDKETAGHKLAPVIRESWFAEELLPKIALHPIEAQEAIQYLAHAASVGTEYKDHLEILLDYLETSGLIQREGSKIMKASTLPPSSKQEEPPKPPASDTPRDGQGREKPPSNSQDSEGAVRFQVSIQVNMSEIATWKPDRIQAFFSGMAQVIAAKGANEYKDV